MASQSIAVYVIYRMMKQAYDIEQQLYNLKPTISFHLYKQLPFKLIFVEVAQ